MNDQTCAGCSHFLQHYTLGSRKIFRVHCGHCTFCKTKHKQPNAQACAHFSPAPPQEDAFASKEYLTKELLQYVRSLELLPQIEDSE